MKIKVNNQETYVCVKHLESEEFEKAYPNLVEHTPLSRGVKPKRITVAEITYDGLQSVGLSHCHENDQFNRRRGSSDAIERALTQHPQFRDNKALRTEVFNKMFRAESSPYDRLAKLVRGKPDLAWELVEYGEKKLAN